MPQFEILIFIYFSNIALVIQSIQSTQHRPLIYAYCFITKIYIYLFFRFYCLSINFNIGICKFDINSNFEDGVRYIIIVIAITAIYRNEN